MKRSVKAVVLLVGLLAVIAFSLVAHRNCIGNDLVTTSEKITGSVEKNILSSEKTLGSIAFYFTTPDAETGEPEIVKALLQFLNQAERSIYGAIYDLDYEPVSELLISKFQRGVDVKLVIERDNDKRLSVLRCRNTGIPIVEDDNSALMHDKFFVVDGRYVWTGSTNITYNCLFLNNNNSVLVQSSQFAENYLYEFQEMFTNHYFGMKSPRNTKYPEIRIDNNLILINMFAPEDGVEQKILTEIDNTQKTIKFMAFSFTSKQIAQRLLDAKSRGILVQGIFEKRNAGNAASKDKLLKHAGIDVRWDSNPKTMHNKVIIFDERAVLTGSYNFTESAEKRNDENALFIYNPEIAHLYSAEFYCIFEKGTPVR